MTRSTPPTELTPKAPYVRWLPNALSLLRLALVPVLVALAWVGLRYVYLGLFLVGQFTDWLDGKLAARFSVRSRFGAVIDSVSDALLYATLIPAVWWLRPGFIARAWPWLAVVVGLYLLHLLVGWARFGRMPSYHTRLAKAGWFVVTAAAVVLLVGGPIWPAWIALGWVALVNIEAIAITLRCRVYPGEVRWLWQAGGGGG